MISDVTYRACLPVLEDAELDEEEQTEKIKAIVSATLFIDGQALEDAVLNVRWQHRSAKNPSKTTPPVRQTIIRQSSPSPWQHAARASTPSLSGSPSIGRASPALPSGMNGSPHPFIRSRSFASASPFNSPRASPRLAFANPIPHSPSLSNYEFNDAYTERNDYGDYGSDNVDWLVNDESGSRPSSSGAGSISEGGLNPAAASWTRPQSDEMSSYDMLRSVMGDGKTDEEIEHALEEHGYDLSATIMTLMGVSSAQQDQSYFPENAGHILVGKSMAPSQPISIDQGDKGRSNIICKYWLSSGSCLRADCRFSHDLSSHICKYWLMGNCLAGDSCIFSHDPALLMSRMSMGDGNPPIPTSQLQQDLQVQDPNAFPVLQASPQISYQASSPGHSNYYRYPSSPGSSGLIGSPRRQFEPRPSAMTGMSSSFSSSGSRPISRHRSPQPGQRTSIPAVDDVDAFPSLGAVGVKAGKKHHGKRGGHGHGHSNKESAANSLADVVRMSPAAGGGPGLLRKGLAKTKTYSTPSGAASSVPPPQHIPWLETGAKANQEYLKSRQDAFKHGGLRNKFLQSAAQAWNRNDARAAKALSLRGQSENELMRKAHREAARLLYEARNKDSSGSSEIYVDLHGLHPDEAVEYLEQILLEQQSAGKPVYAIVGTGHHSKNGKDKVGKAIRAWLGEWKYAYGEFGVGGDGMGGILGIDPQSFDRAKLREGGHEDSADEQSFGGKIRLVKAVERAGGEAG